MEGPILRTFLIQAHYGCIYFVSEFFYSSYLSFYRDLRFCIIHIFAVYLLQPVVILCFIKVCCSSWSWCYITLLLLLLFGFGSKSALGIFLFSNYSSTMLNWNVFATVIWDAQRASNVNGDLYLRSLGKFYLYFI